MANDDGLQGLEAHQAHLESIKPELKVDTLEQARDPETLLWCMEKLSTGTSWEELRRLLGLGPAKEDKRWAAIRKEILGQEVPDGEDDVLAETFMEDRRIKKELWDLVETLKKREEDAKANDPKNRHNYSKYQIDALNSLKETNNGRLKKFLDVKNSKTGKGKYQGVNIHFHSNIPRPPKKAERVVEKITEALVEEVDDE